VRDDAPASCVPEVASGVEIALATYQSEKYLRAQLSSLFDQSYQDFSILVADDGSVDATADILNEYAEKYPGRIKILEFQERAGSACRNFSRILDAARSNYVMFCDHDDVWLSDKVQTSLNRMMELEAVRGNQTPILVHTDLSVVDADLRLKCSSFSKLEGLSPESANFRNLLMQNNVTGCTVLMNRALYDLARPIPLDAPMHDWWVALVASCFGIISFVSQSTILYRQHESNSVGTTKRLGWKKKLRKVAGFLRGQGEGGYKRLARITGQAQLFQNRYALSLNPRQSALVSSVAELWSQPGLSRLWVLVSNRCFAFNVKRTALLLFAAWASRPLNIE
jgi:glycosyltransferase involved in cell wall biosynthesis